jgi:hypothetical protein
MTFAAAVNMHRRCAIQTKLNIRWSFFPKRPFKRTLTILLLGYGALRRLHANPGQPYQKLQSGRASLVAVKNGRVHVLTYVGLQLAVLP